MDLKRDFSNSKVGAHYLGYGKCQFSIWAPYPKSLDLVLLSPRKKVIPMEEKEMGYWQVNLSDISPGTRYLYRIDGKNDKPDPASFYQPVGVHGPSEVVDHAEFKWQDNNWKNISIEEMIFYELHVGTFSKEGTFESICRRLEYLLELGINTIEIMPVGQFPGERNWGYDGAYLFAVQNSNGGPKGLKYLVNECHKRGLAVCLDVVYNHLGPEGNYISQYCPFFTGKYHTPWGSAVNFDDAYSYGVRNLIIQNVLYWFEYFHIDALRLDAIHGIYDMGAKHILEEMAETVAQYCSDRGRKHYLIAESDLNDVRVINSREEGGYNIDNQWSDDFHHALHTLLTGENMGYYADFGRIDQLVKAIEEGFVYSWQYSKYRQRMHGSSSIEIPAEKFTVFIQNHDQVGNRMLGERLSTLVSFDALKLAAGLMLTSPYIPLLFMGEEYAEENPFLYFVSHTDKDLIQAVREGRKNEFKRFGWKKDPPDPQSEETFRKSMPDFNKSKEGKHKAMFEYYSFLITLRKNRPALSTPDKNSCRVWKYEDTSIICMIRKHENAVLFIAANISAQEEQLRLPAEITPAALLLDSYDKKWHGPGACLPESIEAAGRISLKPYQFTIYESEVI
jgi:maltooligosyltrehalose trehalohydrolase